MMPCKHCHGQVIRDSGGELACLQCGRIVQYGRVRGASDPVHGVRYDRTTAATLAHTKVPLAARAELRRRYAAGEDGRALAREFKVSYDRVRHIVSGAKKKEEAMTQGLDD